MACRCLRWRKSAQFDGWMDRRGLDSNIRCSKHERTRSHSKPATMTMTSTDNNVCHTRRHIDRSVLRTSVRPIIWRRRRVAAAAAEGGRESESRSVARSEIEWRDGCPRPEIIFPISVTSCSLQDYDDKGRSARPLPPPPSIIPSLPPSFLHRGEVMKLRKPA